MMGESVMMRELRLCDKGVPGGGGGPEKSDVF